MMFRSVARFAARLVAPEKVLRRELLCHTGDPSLSTGEALFAALRTLPVPTWSITTGIPYPVLLNRRYIEGYMLDGDGGKTNVAYTFRWRTGQSAQPSRSLGGRDVERSLRAGRWRVSRALLRLVLQLKESMPKNPTGHLVSLDRDRPPAHPIQDCRNIMGMVATLQSETELGDVKITLPIDAHPQLLRGQHGVKNRGPMYLHAITMGSEGIQLSLATLAGDKWKNQTTARLSSAEQLQFLLMHPELGEKLAELVEKVKMQLSKQRESTKVSA